MSRRRRLHNERIAQGFCWKCGKKIDVQGKFTKCEQCRKEFNEYMKIRRELKGIKCEPTQNELEVMHKIREEAETEKIARMRKKQLERCERCEWIRLEGRVGYCPFPDGMCIKGIEVSGRG